MAMDGDGVGWDRARKWASLTVWDLRPYRDDVESRWGYQPLRVE